MGVTSPQFPELLYDPSQFHCHQTLGFHRQFQKWSWVLEDGDEGHDLEPSECLFLHTPFHSVSTPPRGCLHLHRCKCLFSSPFSAFQLGSLPTQSSPAHSVWISARVLCFLTRNARTWLDNYTFHVD
ncbi:hypothetical protein PGIGA_G00176420 [Pangasianodon gigas]|uniref:Uncharacterized protein n=1 Tax=Pangasianodon gigas TaxID=30993 RepID=A0ACC5XWZ8_PANGG|nr:hypothetical protein [Pangasianodon gigas]